MHTLLIAHCFALMMTVVSCAQESSPTQTQANWSKPSNGLSAMLVFEVETSSFHGLVVHPIIRLRNNSDGPINFLWCIYDAGIFFVKTSQGTPVERISPPRSGAVGTKTITVNPDEIVEVDAYDYGYGLSLDPDVFTFNTASFQTELGSGVYLVDYKLVVDEETLRRMLKRYDWINEEASSLWAGEIELNDVQMCLE